MRCPLSWEQADAADFLQRELARQVPDVATVVFHSVFMQYVDEAGRRRIEAVISEARRSAGRDSPIFHLRLEPGMTGEARFEIRLDEELLGTSLAHGTGVRWVVDSSAL